jgi:hypothetical protein
MKLAELKAKKAAAVNGLNNARNATFAEGTSETIKANIVAGNVRKYKAQITKLQASIDQIEGRKATNRPTRRSFGQSVLPANFKI